MDLEVVGYHPDMDVVEAAPMVALLPNHFDKPSAVEINSGLELVGRKIAILWDGDKVFYPAVIARHDPSNGAFVVKYHNDESDAEYLENLRKTVWKIWRGTDEEFVAYFNQPVSSLRLHRVPTCVNGSCKMSYVLISFVVRVLCWQNVTSIPALDDELPPPPPEPKKDKKAKIPTYSVMVVDAVIALNDKEGSSLNAIRKHILTSYDIKTQHASFNNLTLKAVNQAVAADILEKVKHSFRLSAREKERRRLAEKQAEAAEVSPSVARCVLSSWSSRTEPNVHCDREKRWQMLCMDLGPTSLTWATCSEEAGSSRPSSSMRIRCTSWRRRTTRTCEKNCWTSGTSGTSS